MPVTMSVDLKVEAVESVAAKGAGGGNPAVLRHQLLRRASRASGTGDGEQDLVYSDRLTVTTTPTDLDLNALSSELDGSTLNLAEITHVLLVNNGSANLLVGGSTNSVAIFADDSDIVVVPPGGLLLWDDPSGLAVGASDTLRLDAASGSISVDVLIVGQSA